MEEMYSDETVKLYWGDVFECLERLPKDTIQAVITSPTYWGKRRFTDDKREFGSEKLEEYVDKNVKLFSSLLNLIKVGGSVFIVIQDTYMGSGISRSHHNHWERVKNPSFRRVGIDSKGQGNISSVTARHDVIKNKSLSGIPYRIALKLVDMGFIWRQQIIWEKPNPMPERIARMDRVRQSAEYVLHFTNSGRYKFHPEPFMVRTKSGRLRLDNQVWVIPSEPKKGHTATFPRKLVERLLLAVTDKGDWVFDPFLGSGTTLDVCLENGRRFIGCDINRSFVEEAVKKVQCKRFTQLESYCFSSLA
jgi:DNA modification methylase